MSEAFRRRGNAPVRPSEYWERTTILFVSHAWDPARDSAEALAGRRLVNALLEAGAHVHVLAASRGDEEFAFKNYRVTTVPPPGFPAGKIRRALRMVQSTIPESEGAWVNGAVNAGLGVLASLPADTMIYGRAMPGASNIVAWQLGSLTKRPWAAHFSDPWPPLHVLAKGRKWLAPYKWPLFEFWRRRIVREAGAVTLTSPGHFDLVLGPNSVRHLAKAFVVPHLPSQSTPGTQAPQYDAFHLVHTGNFYPVAHTSRTLMQGLRLFLDRTPSARGRVRFTQAGWANGDMPQWTERCGLGDVVRLAGRLSQLEVAELLDSASLQLAIDYARPDSSAILSKIPDYVNARRPILAITAPTSSLARLFHDDGAGLMAHYDAPEEVAQQIGTVFAAWENRKLDAFFPHPAAVESFTAGRALAELAGAFEVARAAAIASPARSQRLWPRATAIRANRSAATRVG